MAPYRHSWVLLALVQDFWAKFHRCWGLAREGSYDKNAWFELQEAASAIFRRIGVERRNEQRDPENPDHKPFPKA